MVKHIGFEGAVKKVQSQGHSAASARRIVAASSHDASPAAKKANPRLKKVSAKKKKG